MSFFSVFRKPLTGYTRTGDRTNGRSKPIQGVSFTIYASVHIAKTNELTNDDLTRKETGEIYKLITDSTLNITTKDTFSDIIEYDGRTFEVYRQGKSKNNLLPHNIYFMQAGVLS